MTELAYDDRTSNYTTTNTTKLTTSSTAIIDGLDVTVTGTGAAVEIEFYCPAVANSASLLASSWFVVTVGAAAPVVDAATSQYRNWPASTGGTGGSMRRRLVLTNGVAYKFEVGLSATGASTTTAKGSETVGGPGNTATTGAMYLLVTG